MHPGSLSKLLTVAAVLSVSFAVGAASAAAERVVPASATDKPLAMVSWPKGWQPTGADTTGLYTLAQAERGLEVFKKICSECHEVEDLTNEDFRFEWDGRSVYELYDLVRTTMPDEDPGTLTREQYLDAIAYVLKINNQPDGPSEFVGDSVSASAVILKLGKPVPDSTLLLKLGTS